MVEKYHRIEDAFARLLSETQATISDAERAEVSHYLSHAEYGVALEAIAEMLLAAGSKSSVQVALVFRSLAVEMGLSDKPIVSQFLESVDRS